MSFRLTGSAIALIVSTCTVAASTTSLERFFGTFEACEVSDLFHDYVDMVGNRFANPCCEPGKAAVDEAVPITPPQMIAGAVGEPDATNHGEYTEVRLPLTGDYGGLPVRMLALTFGNENGIFAARLLFDASRTAVEARFGEAVRAANAAGDAAWETEGYGHSVAIPEEEPGSITCDWSV